MNKREREDRLFHTIVLILILALVVLGALLVGRATGAPLSPSAQFAYNVAANSYWQDDLGECSEADVQMAPRFGTRAIVAEFGQCYVYVNRELAGSEYFAKLCEMFVNVIGTWHGLAIPPPKLYNTCSTHDLFLDNHPHYLQRRFR